MRIDHKSVRGFLEVYEFSPTAEEDSDARTINIPEDAVGAAIGVGRMVGRVFHRADDVHVSVTHLGEIISSEGGITAVNGGNIKSYLSSRPPRGEWTVRVDSKTRRNFLVSVAVFRKPLGWLKSIPPGARCRACKAAAKALIWAILAKLTAGGIAALDIKDFAKELAELAKDILDAIADVLGVSAEWLKELFGQVGEIFGFETPWGWLARRICEKLGLCPRLGSGD